MALISFPYYIFYRILPIKDATFTIRHGRAFIQAYFIKWWTLQQCTDGVHVYMFIKVNPTLKIESLVWFEEFWVVIEATTSVGNPVFWYLLMWPRSNPFHKNKVEYADCHSGPDRGHKREIISSRQIYRD